MPRAIGILPILLVSPCKITSLGIHSTNGDEHILHHYIEYGIESCECHVTFPTVFAKGVRYSFSTTCISIMHMQK